MLLLDIVQRIMIHSASLREVTLSPDYNHAKYEAMVFSTAITSDLVA